MIVFLGCGSVVVWLLVWSTGVGAAASPPPLSVHFLDVGQGDATFIETSAGTQVLIDGGADTAVLRELSAVMDFSDRSIDLVIATHPDADHIGGLIDVLERYEVATVVLTETERETATAAAFAAAVRAENANVIYARAGDIFTLGASTTLTILFPDRAATELESNTASVIAQVEHGDVEFLFTGDAPQSVERYLLDRFGDGLQSEVLKVGHHGSDTSTAAEFVAAVQPAVAVVSAGHDNRYGHPHAEVLERLSGIPLRQTAIDGTVSLATDGAVVWELP